MEFSDTNNNDMKIKDKFFETISNGDVISLKQIIKESKIFFWLYKESDGSTALIKSVFLNMSEVSLFLIDEVRKGLSSNNLKEFYDYINKKGDNGFNALHYAAFRGNIKILESLIKSGADINIKNNSGLNVMHMAAQGDQPNVLVFFKEKFEMSTHTMDSVMSTPLHWASYMGAESSVDYLMSWSTDINAKDKDGFTPLHLAVMTEKVRVIKKLIKLGANLNSEDFKNRKPIDIAMCRNNTQIIEILKENVNLFSCNFTQHKSQDSSRFPATFFIYFILLELISTLIILPHLNSLFKYEISIVLSLAIIITYMKLYLSDPGFKINKTYKSLLKLATEGEVLNNICPWCVIYIKNSNRHCYYCNKCVENFDHHCIWIKNCIGSKNFNTFFVYLLLVCTKLIINVFFSFEGLMSSVDKKINLFKLTKIEFLYNAKLKNIFSSIELILSLIVIVPVLFLLFSHLKTLRKGYKKGNSKSKNNLNNEEEQKLLKS